MGGNAPECFEENVRERRGPAVLHIAVGDVLSIQGRDVRHARPASEGIVMGNSHCWGAATGDAYTCSGIGVSAHSSPTNQEVYSTDMSSGATAIASCLKSKSLERSPTSSSRGLTMRWLSVPALYVTQIF
ncbi:hypothetical protein NDU88_001025 [Pleurodeles waltl]|uniref:Uncharacterized protein n=1 Tax=Pleurodeles waltl TaxID=8319 RepID=A0AAV7L9U0_PLEWA|nr:hypothetical protein NDU88_001025 [Pleurodeles waltl]